MRRRPSERDGALTGDVMTADDRVMTQLTLRVPDELVDRLKIAARERGESVNRWATAVLAAAVDPTFAGDDAQVLRERLARAGLLVPTSGRGRRPSRPAVARADIRLWKRRWPKVRCRRCDKTSKVAEL